MLIQMVELSNSWKSNRVSESCSQYVKHSKIEKQNEFGCLGAAVPRFVLENFLRLRLGFNIIAFWLRPSMPPAHVASRARCLPRFLPPALRASRGGGARILASRAHPNIKP
jgi:hypothetical protein